MYGWMEQKAVEYAGCWFPGSTLMCLDFRVLNVLRESEIFPWRINLCQEIYICK